PAPAGEKPAPACANQSPRVLQGGVPASKSIVSKGPNDTIVYTPRGGGKPETLRRCGQHYHYPIENLQPLGPGQPTPGTEGGKPAAGDWVEVHTVYALKLNPEPCDPETLQCCLVGPFVVLGYHAKVTAGAGGKESGSVPVQWKLPAAEWT